MTNKMSRRKKMKVKSLERKEKRLVVQSDLMSACSHMSQRTKKSTKSSTMAKELVSKIK